MKNNIEIGFEELNPYVRRAGRQENSSWKNRTRKIYDHEFLYCINGKAYITIEERSHNITPGTLVLIKPDRSHSLWMDEQKPADMLWIHFDFIYRKDVYGLNELVKSRNSVLFKENLPLRQYIRPEPELENGIKIPELIKVEQKGSVEVIFKRIIYSFEKTEKFWQLECKTLMLQLLNMVMQQLVVKGYPTVLQGSEDKVKSIKDFVFKNYFRKISINEISSFVGLSEDYCGKLFKNLTGENIVHFINRVRLWHASELITNTDLNLTNIAEMTGFSDLYYFSKVVRKYEGVSPTEWAKVLKNLVQR